VAGRERDGPCPYYNDAAMNSRVLSVDGHVVEWSFAFTVKAALR